MNATLDNKLETKQNLLDIKTKQLSEMSIKELLSMLTAAIVELNEAYITIRNMKALRNLLQQKSKDIKDYQEKVKGLKIDFTKIRRNKRCVARIKTILSMKGVKAL